MMKDPTMSTPSTPTYLFFPLAVAFALLKVLLASSTSCSLTSTS